MSNYMFLDYILCQETMEEGGRRQGSTIKNEIFVLFLYLEKVRKFRINKYMCLIIFARGGPLPPPPKKKR